MIKILIGFGDNKEVLLAIEEAIKKKDLSIEIAKSNEELLSKFKNKEFDAIVRGSLSSSIIKELKLIKNSQNSNNSSTSQTSNIYRASYIIKDDYEFLLAPVGIDEGETLEEKFNLIMLSCEFIEKMGKIPKIAILANGRKEDIGRNQIITDSIKNSEKLTDKLINRFKKTEIYKTKNDFSIKNYYILIEEAISEKNNIIIAPDGISGNLIFRTLALVNSWESHGAIMLGFDKIFIDTSRSQDKNGFLRAINLAYNLSKNKNNFIS